MHKCVSLRTSFLRMEPRITIAVHLKITESKFQSKSKLNSHGLFLRRGKHPSGLERRVHARWQSAVGTPLLRKPDRCGWSNEIENKAKKEPNWLVAFHFNRIQFFEGAQCVQSLGFADPEDSYLVELEIRSHVEDFLFLEFVFQMWQSLILH